MSFDLKSKLSQLKELHELGLLTDAEMAEQKRTLLGAALGTTPTGRAVPSLPGPTQIAPSTPAPTKGLSAAVNSPPPSLSGATHIAPSGGVPSRLGNYQV